MMICFRETTFWAKRSLSFVFRGPNSVHPEVFRCVNHNGTNFKAVWWSVSEKPHFGLKHHFPLYLEGQTQCILRFQACQSQWYKFQSCMMICFRETTFWAKTSLSFVFRGPNSVHQSDSFQVCQSQWYRFQSCMMICFWETTFWAKTLLSFVFRGPNSVHPEVFRCANHNGTNFKAVWWSVSEKPHFGLKHHFPLYLEGQTQCTWGFQLCQSQWYRFQSCMMICFWVRNHILG